MSKTIRETEHSPIFDKLVAINKTLPVIWIRGNVPSLKNSKKIILVPSKQSTCCRAPMHKLAPKNYICSHCKKKTMPDKSYRIVPSDAVVKYLKENESVYYGEDVKAKFAKWIQLAGSEPIYLGFYFVRLTEGVWDFNNGTQVVTDTLVRAGVFSGDDISRIVPVYLGHHKNADQPGVILISLPHYQSSNLNYLNQLNERLLKGL